MLLAKPGGRGHAVGPRHPEIHQDDVGTERPGEGEGLVAVTGLADHLEIRHRVEHRPQTSADHEVVVRQQHPDGHGPVAPLPVAAGIVRRVGSCTATVVPSPGALSMESEPPSAFTRSRMAARPSPPPGRVATGRAGSNPRPLSWTSNATSS